MIVIMGILKQNQVVDKAPIKNKIYIAYLCV